MSTDGTEGCGNCTAGFVDFVRFNSSKGCQNISELPWEEFYDVARPQYSSALNVTLEERLVQLYDVLQFISEFRSQIPPPLFTVDLNSFSADVPADYQGLAGHRAKADAAFDVGFDRFVVSDRLLQSIPAEIDWEARGATTYVKNQVGAKPLDMSGMCSIGRH